MGEAAGRADSTRVRLSIVRADAGSLEELRLHTTDELEQVLGEAIGIDLSFVDAMPRAAGKLRPVSSVTGQGNMQQTVMAHESCQQPTTREVLP